jgi:N utilization substance protein A
VAIEDLAGVEGFDESVAGELQQRARRFIEEREERNQNKIKELGVAADMADIPGLDSAMLVALGEAGIKTRDDLADLASDELIERDGGPLRRFNLSLDDANAIIMAARAHWFGDGAGDGASADGAQA